MRGVEWADGGPRVRQVPEPVPGPGEVLVEVTRVGVTLPVVRAGAGGVLGGDVAGRVLSAGADAGEWVPGTRVVAVAAAGAYAEQVAVPAPFVAAVPDGVSDDDAVALVRGGQVALGALRAASVRDGDAVLVTAAAGGVGHLAVQLARVLGAGRVVAAVGPTAPTGRSAMLTALGATEVRAYDALDGCEPVDVVLDGAGGPVLAQALAVLAPRGRLVVYNGVGGPVESNDLRRLGQSVIGFAMPHMVAVDPSRYAEQRELLWSETRRSQLRPIVHGPFGFDDVAAAHAVIAQRRNVGKVVLRP